MKIHLSFIQKDDRQELYMYLSLCIYTYRERNKVNDWTNVNVSANHRSRFYMVWLVLLMFADWFDVSLHGA